MSESSNDLLTLLHLYNSELSSVLDKHAPLKSRMVTIRPAAPWFSEEIKLERRVRCQKGDGVGLDCPKIVCVLLNKIVLSMSYYSLSADNITPNLLMIIALIRGNCLALSVSCYIGVLHRSIHLALPWRILQIDSLAFLVRRLLLFDMNWNRTLCRELIYLMKPQ